MKGNREIHCRIDCKYNEVKLQVFLININKTASTLFLPYETRAL